MPLPPEGGHDENNSKLHNKTTTRYPSPSRTTEKNNAVGNYHHLQHQHHHHQQYRHHNNHHPTQPDNSNGSDIVVRSDRNLVLRKNESTSSSNFDVVDALRPMPMSMQMQKRDNGAGIISSPSQSSSQINQMSPRRVNPNDENSSLTKECKEDDFASLRMRHSSDDMVLGRSYGTGDDGGAVPRNHKRHQSEDLVLGRSHGTGDDGFTMPRNHKSGAPTPPRPRGASEGADNSLSGIPRGQQQPDMFATATTASSSQASHRPPSNKKTARSSMRSSSPNRIPRVPKDTSSTNSSPKIRTQRPTLASSTPNMHYNNYPQDKDSVHSLASSGGPVPMTNVSQITPIKHDLNWPRKQPDDHEQALFQQRLCDDPYGVAVRKINQNGKSNLRYVKCIYMDCSESDYDMLAASTKSSVSSLARSAFSAKRRTPSYTHHSSDYHHHQGIDDQRQDLLAQNLSQRSVNLETGDSHRIFLTWGKKNIVRLSLNRFLCVRKGKTTERARRNPCPPSRILSLITDDPSHPSLDIEAPTRLDRDKFARAFSRFLQIPLEDNDIMSAHSADYAPNRNVGSVGQQRGSAFSASGLERTPKKTAPKLAKETIRAPLPVVMTSTSSGGFRHVELQTEKQADARRIAEPKTKVEEVQEEKEIHIQSLPESLKDSDKSTGHAPSPSKAKKRVSTKHDNDDGTQVSSLTGAGFDQEIVEELHQALNDLRAELEESRAEAARAVKVAEQAIQSAENSSSRDWNSTVTHKAAEAAALAQKKSAEAMAKQRLAEERLDGERRNAAFWRKQAEAAEDEAGALQTRAAAAEVQRAAMAEELESERRKASLMVGCLKNRYSSLEGHQREALESAMDRNRTLELELDGTRRDLLVKNDEAKLLQEAVSMLNTSDVQRNGNRKKPFLMGRKKKGQDERDSCASRLLLSGVNSSSSSNLEIQGSESTLSNGGDTERILKLHAEAAVVRKNFELMKKATVDELRTLPEYSRFWASQVSQAVNASQSEILLLREKLALESATRRKLLHEVQDLRGTVRVYCRPRPASLPQHATEETENNNSIFSTPSQEALLLHREQASSNGATISGQSLTPLSFKFDRVFDPATDQKEIYNEIEDVCLGVLDGYNICLLCYGPTGCGKTYSLLGDVRYPTTVGNEKTRFEIKEYGVHMESVRQLFSIAEHRSDRYQDVFTMTIVEVHNERLCDLLAGTEIAESRGYVTGDENIRKDRKGKRGTGKGASTDEGSATQPSQSSKSQLAKLEIRTNHNGDTIVQGAVSIEVKSFEDVYRVWEQCLTQRANRLAEQGLALSDYEAASHVIATLNVTTMNTVTGIGSIGRIQFVDLAGADLVSSSSSDMNNINGKKASNIDGILSDVTATGENNKNSAPEWKFADKSLATLSEVVNCRSQFMHNVPYRTSTLTHLLRDNLEADTKVLCLVCISSDPKDLQESASALRFASKMRRVNVGKATKHTLSRS